MNDLDWLQINGLGFDSRGLPPVPLSEAFQQVPPAPLIGPEERAKLDALLEEMSGKKKKVKLEEPPVSQPSPMLHTSELPVQTPAYSPETGTSPVEQSLAADLRKKFKQLVADSEQGIADNKQAIQDFKKIPQGIDVTPLAALSDAWNPGSNLSAAAKAMAPMKPEERAIMLSKLQEQLQGNQDKLAATVGSQLKQYNDQKAAMQMQNLALRQARLDLVGDNQAASAAKIVHSDKPLMQLRQNASNVDRGMHLLENGTPTVTTMHEIAQDFAAALANGKIASDFKLKSVSTPTLEEQRKKLEAFLTSNPNQPAPPEVIRFWTDMGQRLQEAYGRQMSSRASEVVHTIGTQFAHNPNAVKAAQDQATLYKTGAWKGLGLDEAPATPAPAPQVLSPEEWLKQKRGGQ